MKRAMTKAVKTTRAIRPAGQIVKPITKKKNCKKLLVTFSTPAGRCLHFLNIRSPQWIAPVRESRLTRGSAEGAGAIGGLAPAPFVFIFRAVHSVSYF